MTYKKNFTNTFTIRGREYTVTAPALFDSKTNKLIPDNKLDDVAVCKARQMYRDNMGLLGPKDLKKYRKKVGLSQRNLAELTGLSPNTIALYEAGEFLTKANNHLLKSLISSDQVLENYISDKSSHYSDELVAKVVTYVGKK